MKPFNFNLRPSRSSYRTLTAFAFATTAIVTCFAMSSAVAHEGHVVYGADGKLQQHDSMGIKLPFDPIFCDLNNNQNIDADEVSLENDCRIEDVGNELFATKPIASLGLNKGQLVLTIDDGPHPSVTPRILDLLDVYGIKATFFVVGSRVPEYPGIIRDIYKRGHVIGNHTYSHDIKNITASTITNEVLKAHQAVVAALGGVPKGRILFRAPGLGWSEPKAVNLNDNKTTRTFIGPIHANLGTDQPRADWSCWNTKKSADTCANYYYQDILNAGRGIVLTHDIYYSSSNTRNTYEMLKILLSKLDQAGGIKRNGTGSGVWQFVTMQNLDALDKYDIGGPGGATVDQQPAPVEKTAEGYIIDRNFAKVTAYVRTKQVIEENALNEKSLVSLGGNVYLNLGHMEAVALTGKEVVVGGYTFKEIRIEKVQKGLENIVGQTAYVWADAL